MALHQWMDVWHRFEGGQVAVLDALQKQGNWKFVKAVKASRHQRSGYTVRDRSTCRVEDGSCKLKKVDTGVDAIRITKAGDFVLVTTAPLPYDVVILDYLPTTSQWELIQ